MLAVKTIFAGRTFDDIETFIIQASLISKSYTR